MDYQYLLFDVADDIATLTLNRPESLNALNAGLVEEFGHALAQVRARAGEDIKVLIITGAGRAFCAGGDVKVMDSAQRTPVMQRNHLRASQHRMLELLNLELPVISLVNGAAAGAGANIALAADFVFATPRAMFMQAFGRIGLIPDWGGLFVLPRLVGLQKAKELVFTARKVRVEEAQALGLVHTVVNEASAMTETRAFAARLAHASTTAVGVAKSILNQSHNLDARSLLEMEATGQGICVSSAYHREAVRRFAAREPALYDWEALSAPADGDA